MKALEVDFDDPPAESFETATPRRSVQLPARKLSPAEAGDAIRSGSAQAALMGGNGSHPSGIGRSLPHSIEAEENLISCCLIDDGATLEKAVESRVGPDSFYGGAAGAHGIVFATLLRMREAKKPIETAVVAEELKAGRQLDAVGGYAFLTQVSSKIPTTAQATYFIEKVREQSLLREIIRSATGAVEECYNFSGGIDEFAAEVATRLKAVVDEGAPGRRSPSRPLTSFGLVPDGDRSILLGNRYLNRGDGAVLSSTSGMGKSSMSVQMAVLWALGRPAFGIPPNGCLRSLIVQSEDSDGDVAEIWASIAHVLKLAPPELAQVQERVLIVNDRTNRGAKFISSLRRLIQAHQPDLVWVNPLQAFMDGDVTDSRDLGAFLREGLNGLNDPPAFSYMVVHHTTKPATGKDRAERLWHEVMYDMAGGAEIINWARAILSLRAAKAEGDFNLVLAKRGRRAGATRKKEQGAGFVMETITTIPLRHAQGFVPMPGMAKGLPLIFWEEREPDAVAESPDTKSGGRPAKFDFTDYRNIFPGPETEGMEIAPLHRKLCTNLDIPKKTLHSALQRWADEGLVEIIRPEGRPMRYRRVV